MSQYIRALLPFALVVSSAVAVVPAYAQDGELSSSNTTSETEVAPSELNKADGATESQPSLTAEELKKKNGNLSAQAPDNKPSESRVPIFSRIFPFAPLMRQ
jgi:hypothetical protein